MIKLGIADLVNRYIGTTPVQKVMQGTTEIWGLSGFAITKHPLDKSGDRGDPVFTLTVEYVPVEATVQWQWRNPTEQDVPQWFDISGEIADSYTMQGGTLVLAQNDDRFRANVTFDGETLSSDEAVITVNVGDVQEITGGAKTFLAAPTSHYYSGAKPGSWNKTMESLPADKVFPFGQKMFISTWAPGSSEIVDSAAAGFTVGCYQNHYWYSGTGPAIRSIVANGMEVMGYIRDMAGNHSGGNVGDLFDSTAQATLVNYHNAEQQAYLDDPDVGNHIHSWMYCLDDEASQVDAAKMGYVVNGIGQYGEKLGVGNFPIAGAYRTGSYSRYIPEHSNFLSQTYIYGGSGCKTEDANYGTEYWRIRSNARMKEWAMYKHQVDLSSDSPYGAPRILPIAPGPFVYRVHEFASLLNNSTFYIKEYKHDVLLALMSGCNSYILYQANTGYLYCGVPTSHYNTCLAGAFDFWKRMTDNEADKALLWGKGAEPFVFGNAYTSPNTKPITESRRSGSPSYIWYPSALYHAGLPTSWNTGREEAVEYMLSFRDVQFKDKRYIFIVNSHPSVEYVNEGAISSAPINEGKITSRFSGLPDDGTHVQLKATDILTDTSYPINPAGYIDIETEAASAAVLVIEAADGWITPQ